MKLKTKKKVEKTKHRYSNFIKGFVSSKLSRFLK